MQPRSRVLGTLSMLLLAGAALATAAPRAAPEPGAARGMRPNIVLVLADDLGFGDVGANGARLIRTPNLDALARRGVRLTQFFAGANVCTPSRAALLTGRYPVRSGLAIDVIYPHSDYGIPDSEVLLPEALREAGYHTWLVGKWHLGHVPQAWPTRHGFEYFFGLPASNDMPNAALYRNTERVQFPLDQSGVHERLVDEAVRLIESAGPEPFFLYFAPVAPHIPLHPGAKFAGRSRAGPYGDVVEELDAGLGRILAALSHRSLADNTIVVFSSDNGPAFEGSAGTSLGRKATPFEGGYRVPFIARWPGRIPAGAVSNAISMNIDLFPTLLAAAGAAPPAVPIDGRDVTALWRGSSRSPHEALYFFQDAKIAAVRTQRWRLVTRTIYRTYDVDLVDELQYPLLFDIAQQDSELYNLGPREPQVLAHLLTLLQEGRTRFESLPQRETPWPPP